ncbi:hypothetical protein SAMN02910447_02913 [Ruminococcus sp. YE71]|uniref:hypothetical protein n=1 Tax=unclassified Ruminococcus TaxID=2608920 RepID=UPI000884BFD5|nr:MULTISPECIES: hypothetical protein [unclassified Ruminococcus]SDA28614.1 hypothetical protein SAMN02910446_02983 [Ruminococcus sp. YE78]SFW46714.1 hypothetical protein SAMN02910447_02913 [Ruminococcus sp. YE71]
MPNERIKEEMILAGVTVADLADFLGKTEKETVDILNTELGIMQNYNVMLAVTEIVKIKERV